MNDQFELIGVALHPPTSRFGLDAAQHSERRGLVLASPAQNNLHKPANLREELLGISDPFAVQVERDPPLPRTRWGWLRGQDRRTDVVNDRGLDE